jgi:hypothetical protein
MFTLTIDNKQLILGTDFGVPLIYKNPCWCFDEIPAPLCLDVTIPDNDVNRNYLGFPGRFAKKARSNDRKFPRAELRWRGYLYIFGTLVITEASEDGYSGYIQSELRSLSDAQREKLISDSELGGDLTFENKPDYDPDTDLYCTIRLANPGFWVDKGDTEPWKKPKFKDDGSPDTPEDTTREILTRKFEHATNFEFMVNYPATGGVKTSGADDEVVVVSPYPFISRLIELLLRENKFFVRDSFLLTDDTLKTLCLYNNRSICKVVNTVEEVEVTYINTYHLEYSLVGTEKINTQTWATNTFQLKKLLPKLAMNELLLSVQNLTNTFFHFTGIDDVDNIDRESLFDMEPFDLSKYRVSRWLPGQRQNLLLRFKFEHDADDQEFNENYTDISSREDDIKDPVTYYADLAAIVSPTIGDIRLVEVEKMYYEYRQETVNEKDVLIWAPITVDIQDYKYNKTGDDSEDIQTKFSTLRMHKNGYPIVYQKGNNSQFSQFSENFTPRLLFYTGNNTGGSTATSGLAIDWKSLVEKRYRRTAPFYANALPVLADFRFPGNIFYKVLNEIYKPYLDRDGSFFIKEMEIQANHSEYVNARLTVFKNEDNVFVYNSETVDGTGEHAGGVVFVPKFIGVTLNGQPMLVDEAGLTRPMPVFGEISDADYAPYTCVDYSAEHKLLFVGGKAGQVHVCDLSDMDNIRYKTIQIFDTYSVSGISIVDTVYEGKQLMIGRAHGCQAYKLPILAAFDNYASGQAQAMQAPGGGTGHLRSFIFYDTYIYACSRDGEIFRGHEGIYDAWNRVSYIHPGELIQLRKTATRMWAAERSDRSQYSSLSAAWNFYIFSGLAGTKQQQVRAIEPLTGDQSLWMCEDDNEGIWRMEVSTVNGGISSANITPAGIKNAGGACFDGTTNVYVSVKDSAGYAKIGTYTPYDIPTIPGTPWSLMNVGAFFGKLWLY